MSFKCSHNSVTNHLALSSLITQYGTDLRSCPFDDITLKYFCKNCNKYVYFNINALGECYGTGRVFIDLYESFNRNMKKKFLLDFTHTPIHRPLLDQAHQVLAGSIKLSDLVTSSAPSAPSVPSAYSAYSAYSAPSAHSAPLAPLAPLAPSAPLAPLAHWVPKVQSKPAGSSLKFQLLGLEDSNVHTQKYLKTVEEVIKYVNEYLKDRYCRGDRDMKKSDNKIIFHDYRHCGSLNIIVLGANTAELDHIFAEIEKQTPKEYE